MPLGDQMNMVFSGSFVTYGRGTFVVTGIGMETEVGKIASLLKTTSEKRTPLQINLDQFGQKLSILILYSLCNPHSESMCCERRIIRRCLSVCSSACGCGNSGGVEFYCNNRTFFWYAEDGKRTCDHPKTPGCRRSGKCVCHLF